MRIEDGDPSTTRASVAVQPPNERSREAKYLPLEQVIAAFDKCAQASPRRRCERILEIYKDQREVREPYRDALAIAAGIGLFAVVVAGVAVARPNPMMILIAVCVAAAALYQGGLAFAHRGERRQSKQELANLKAAVLVAIQRARDEGAHPPALDSAARDKLRDTFAGASARDLREWIMSG